MMMRIELLCVPVATESAGVPMVFQLPEQPE